MAKRVLKGSSLKSYLFNFIKPEYREGEYQKKWREENLKSYPLKVQQRQVNSKWLRQAISSGRLKSTFKPFSIITFLPNQRANTLYEGGVVFFRTNVDFIREMAFGSGRTALKTGILDIANTKRKGEKTQFTKNAGGYSAGRNFLKQKDLYFTCLLSELQQKRAGPIFGPAPKKTKTLWETGPISANGPALPGKVLIWLTLT